MEFEEEPQAKTDHERISISVVQHHGRFRRAIPCMPMTLAGFCCLCNVFIPGLGTMFAAFSVLCCADSCCESRLASFGTNLLAAFLQLITCPLVIGFIWSIIWGVLFIQIAHQSKINQRIEKRQEQQKDKEMVGKKCDLYLDPIVSSN